MALIRLVLDKHKIPRREFSELFTVTEGFYLAIQNTPAGLQVRSAPFARSSMLIKGPKYDKSIKLARQALHSLENSPAVRLYTAYSPEDKTYFVSGFETLIHSNEETSSAEQKILQMREAWESTLAEMKLQGIDVWSK